MLDKKEEAIRRAKQAELLLQDPLLIAAFAAAKKDADDANHSATNEQAAWLAHCEWVALDTVERKLKGWIDSGKLAQVKT